MGHVITMLYGPTGSWKTVTSLTSRGKIAVIDRDNQMAMYAGNQEVVKIGGTLPAKDAIWTPKNDTDTTREAVREWTARIGLQSGDTLVDDPFARLWELTLDAADVNVAKKGEKKPDWFTLRKPTTRLMTFYRYAPFDIVLTAHEKAKWSKTEDKPTGEVTHSGEPSKTPTDIHFIWRMEMGAGGMQYVCQKEKGFRFRVGQTIPWCPLKTLYGDAGIYDLLDGIQQGDEPDIDQQVEQAVQAIFNGPSLPLDYEEEMGEGIKAAMAAGKLAAFRTNPENVRKFLSLPAKAQARLRAAMEAK